MPSNNTKPLIPSSRETWQHVMRVIYLIMMTLGAFIIIMAAASIWEHRQAGNDMSVMVWDLWVESA
ncbi:hypothetical protein FBY14_12448 [Azospirillum brasilense]|nr:hypothetical protein FBY14_12448 [Azospirillum brasilense]